VMDGAREGHASGDIFGSAQVGQRRRVCRPGWGGRWNFPQS
jgi:hypothetical protein